MLNNFLIVPTLSILVVIVLTVMIVVIHAFKEDGDRFSMHEKNSE